MSPDLVCEYVWKVGGTVIGLLACCYVVFWLLMHVTGMDE